MHKRIIYLYLILLASCSSRLKTPADLKAVALTDSTVQLTWIGLSTGEEGFIIQEATEGRDFRDAFRAPQDAKSIVIERRRPGATYRYRIQPFAGTKRGDLTEAVEVSTPKTIPAAPSNLTLKVVATTAIQLSWDDNAVSEYGFIIQRKNLITGEWEEVARIPRDYQYYLSSGLMTHTEYSFQVCSFNPTAASDFTPVAKATTADYKEITVTYPNGGEVIDHPEMFIKWEADPGIIMVKVTIFNQEGIYVTPEKWIFSATPDEGVMHGDFPLGVGKPWGVGEYIFKNVGMLPPSKTYKVRVTDTKSDRFDDSDGYFEVK